MHKPSRLFCLQLFVCFTIKSGILVQYDIRHGFLEFNIKSLLPLKKEFMAFLNSFFSLYGCIVPVHFICTLSFFPHYPLLGTMLKESSNLLSRFAWQAPNKPSSINDIMMYKVFSILFSSLTVSDNYIYDCSYCNLATTATPVIIPVLLPSFSISFVSPFPSQRV